MSAGMGANTSAGGFSDFGLRGIRSPHAMPHTQNFRHSSFSVLVLGSGSRFRVLSPGSKGRLASFRLFRDLHFQQPFAAARPQNPEPEPGTRTRTQNPEPR